MSLAAASTLKSFVLQCEAGPSLAVFPRKAVSPNSGLLIMLQLGSPSRRLPFPVSGSRSESE